MTTAGVWDAILNGQYQTTWRAVTVRPRGGEEEEGSMVICCLSGEPSLVSEEGGQWSRKTAS